MTGTWAVSRKDVRLSHSSLVSKGEHGHSHCRQLGDGEGRAVTRSIFVCSEPPSLAQTPPKPHFAVLHGFRCFIGLFA